MSYPTNKLFYIILIMVYMLFGFTSEVYIFNRNQEIPTTLGSLTLLLGIDKEILGTWIREDDPTQKIVFSPFGIIKTYINNSLDTSGNYIITTSCEGETYDNADGSGFYLKTKDATESFWTCQYLFGVNEEGSGILSLGNKDQYTVIRYVKQ